MRPGSFLKILVDKSWERYYLKYRSRELGKWKCEFIFSSSYSFREKGWGEPLNGLFIFIHAKQVMILCSWRKLWRNMKTFLDWWTHFCLENKSLQKSLGVVELKFTLCFCRIFFYPWGDYPLPYNYCFFLWKYVFPCLSNNIQETGNWA